MGGNGVLRLGLAACLFVAACSGDPLRVADEPAQYVAVRRAWQPGERDATILRYQTTRPWVVPMAGDATDAVIAGLDPDSVTQIVANPLLAPMVMPGLSLASRFSSSWDIVGMDLLLIDANSVPRDTVHWVGVFWSDPAEPTWKGYVLAARPASSTTVPQTQVRTNNFDAGGGKAGAGGGEARQTTGQFWQADGPGSGVNNTITISDASYGTPTTLTGGPFTGGTEAVGTMMGRLRTIPMDLAAGTGTPTTITVDFDFSASSIVAVRYECSFPSPCTTNAGAMPAAWRAALGSRQGAERR